MKLKIRLKKEERFIVEEKAKGLGLDITELFTLDPDRFKNDHDRPCHPQEERVGFWKDVLLSLHLSYESLFREARRLNEERKEFDPEITFLTDMDIISGMYCYWNFLWLLSAQKLPVLIRLMRSGISK